VVGAGGSGLRAVVGCSEAGLRTACITKVFPTRSHTVAAQGGIAAALGNMGPDDWRWHMYDTVKGSDYIGDQDAIEYMCSVGPQAVYELEHLGMPFSRTESGRIYQRPFGGQSKNFGKGGQAARTCAAADRTGHALLHTLYQANLRAKTTFLNEWFAVDLVTNQDGKVVGVIAIEIETGEVVYVESKATVFATGGAGRIYASTTNALMNTGDGVGMALRAGLPVQDIEMWQFHPTGIAGAGVLVTEGCRGEGGYLINKDGERFMERYAPNALELASRDVVSRSETTEIEAGRGLNGSVMLDLRHLGPEKILNKLPGSRELAMTYAGVDPIFEPIPVRPGAHYHMGGVATDEWGQTEIEGLYAAGEAACVSVHGANRLGGNSLMETITFGRRSGRHAAEYALGRGNPTAGNAEAARADAETWVKGILDVSSGERPWQVRDELGQSMLENFGVFRYPDRMEKQIGLIDEYHERYERGVVIEDKGQVFNSDLTQAIELGYLLDLGACMLQAGLARKESRGAHSRPSDFPERDDQNFLKHSITRWVDGVPQLTYAEVRMTKWEPMVRTY
jgi:succinate dehydrogenase / fumarate reductase flavoprotein subunit